MLPRSTRRIAMLLTFAVSMAGTAFASEIRMVDGTVYSGVTITRRDGANVECYTQRGRTLLPAIDIARIDGVRMSDIPEDTYPRVTSLGDPSRVGPPSPTPLPRPPPAVPTASPPRKRVPASVSPTPRAIIPTPLPRATIAPSPAVRAGTTPSPTPTLHAAADSKSFLPTGRLSTENLAWVLLTGVIFIAVWVFTIVRVLRDFRRVKPANFRVWQLVVMILPIIGYALYELARAMQNRPRGRHLPGGVRREFTFLDAEHRPITINANEEASGLENAKGVLQDALLDRASDVHIEPGATECRVRFRIDGVLNPRMKFSAEEGLRLISALKTVAQLDIAERRKAQDGRFGGRTGDKEVDFRAATTPSVYGEKLVLRILDQKSGLRGLSELGMSERMMKRFAEVIQSRSGMILATGPTGSGKTSSLYAALSQLDSVRLNIVTIEDPVEYELGGATQIPVNIKAGITYESGLRSILRQDPDVILVGEMRDLEAAQIALRSALTGHLVFSSLHTRDAIGTIHRLEEMGIERHLLASSLFVVMAQRLVRILCPACREAYPSTGKELAEIGLELPPGETIYRAVGCRRCEGAGYTGRTGIFEMLVLDDDLRREINAGASEETFANLARPKGYRGYREDGAEKVLLGITSVDEVLKAT